MKIINKKSENSLIDQFIKNLKKDHLKKKRQNKRFSFVLTGGESPRNLYRKLAKANIDWDNIDLFWGDERYVSHFSKNSNYKPVTRKDFKRITLSLNVINNSKKILLWLNNKSITRIYSKIKKNGGNIPVNNLNRKRTVIYSIN